MALFSNIISHGYAATFFCAVGTDCETHVVKGFLVFKNNHILLAGLF